MKVLRFDLSGDTAFFKKPDVNTYLYFTYGNIHKVALIGIFGAILGLKGYNQMFKEDEFPEFYTKLKDLKVAIKPNNHKGFIPKKVQIFNNSVGYASKEQGGNLIVKEQWLENPSWTIYLIVDGKESEILSKNIIEKKAVYIPYLGKNDHLAKITNAVLYEDVNEVKEVNKIDCLCLKSLIEFEECEFDFDNLDKDRTDEFKYEESLPVALSKETNTYTLDKFIYSNMDVSVSNDCKVYSIEDYNIVFY